METNQGTSHLVRFGVFELDVRTGELRKRGMRIPLQEQPLRVLSTLLEAPGEIVTRQDLCRRLWPDGTHVDFEHSLNAAVRRLRVALGDEASVPRFIETVPRRGYRFVAMNDMFPRRVAHAQNARHVKQPATGTFSARLAVIPFAMIATGEHLTGTPEAANFVEGLVDEAITQLARACPRDIGVIARASVARVAADALSAADVGRALDADFLLEGTVRRDGTRIRITAQLIASEEETHIWAATYDRVLTDALTAQQEIAEAITAGVMDALAASIGDRPASIADRPASIGGSDDGNRRVG
jgi:TolB-like protein